MQHEFDRLDEDAIATYINQMLNEFWAAPSGPEDLGEDGGVLSKSANFYDDVYTK